MIATNFVPFSQIRRTISAGETVRTKQLISNFSSFVRCCENLLADGAARPERTIEVLFTVKLAKFGEAGISERNPTGGALEAVLMKAAIPHSQDVLVFNLSVTL